ncbi:MAG: hypothetical protein AB7N91_12600 [Candidatus Tectimicrobiota bacterium]
MLDRAALLGKIFWQLQANWHLRQRPTPQTLTVPETVQGLQAMLLAEEGAMLRQTLACLYGQPVALETLQRLDISLYQEGAQQRVWRAHVTLPDQAPGVFGLIAARAPGASSALTRDDFLHLRHLHALQARYCVAPYVAGTMPVADGVAAYTVEWLDQHKELVFEVTLDGGVFLVNAVGAQYRFSPQESRRIWRSIVDLLWYYPTLRGVNIQAGDFVGQRQAEGAIALKLTTARALAASSEPEERIHTMLGWLITASGYLSDGQRPFDRAMGVETFLPRMQAVLQRRFGARAPALAQQQWELFRTGVLARQEDWLKEDVIQATYAHLRASASPQQAWDTTCQWWSAYAEAVQAGRFAPSWWFPAAEIPPRLQTLRQRGNAYQTE